MDLNTKDFHSLLKHRRRRSNLLLLDENGAMIEDVEELNMRVKNHYENCFEERLLLFPFTEDEINEEAWNCYGNKSPRPDRFSLQFIKGFWDFLCVDIVAILNQFYSKVTLQKAFSSSIIARIPKNDHPQDLREFQPIYFIVCIYKIIAKVLASRLKRLLPKVISKYQSAFLGGRQHFR